MVRRKTTTVGHHRKFLLAKPRNQRQIKLNNNTIPGSSLATHPQPTNRPTPTIKKEEGGNKQRLRFSVGWSFGLENK